MRIVLLSVQKLNNYLYKVDFSSEYGKSYAIWRGCEPKINNSYDVEFEIPGIFSGKDIVLVCNTEPKSMSFINGEFRFKGIIESLDEDGHCIIRIREDFFFIETNEVLYPVGSVVSFFSESIILYDANM